MLRKIIALIASIHFFSIADFAQVNQQTGSAVYSLPIFSWSDTKLSLIHI